MRNALAFLTLWLWLHILKYKNSDGENVNLNLTWTNSQTTDLEWDAVRIHSPEPWHRIQTHIHSVCRPHHIAFPPKAIKASKTPSPTVLPSPKNGQICTNNCWKKNVPPKTTLQNKRNNPTRISHRTIIKEKSETQKIRWSSQFSRTDSVTI